jgi:hypothetical protein
LEVATARVRFHPKLPGGPREALSFQVDLTRLIVSPKFSKEIVLVTFFSSGEGLADHITVWSIISGLMPFHGKSMVVWDQTSLSS